MLFRLPLPLQALVFSLLFPNIPTFYAVKAGFTNVTVDDNNPSIFYSSGWTVSDSSNPLNYGGYHHLSDQPNATAEFNFTGVGIYFLSPLWPYAVRARLALDGNPATTVDLQDYTQPVSADGGSETVPSTVVWGAGGLDMGNHTLHISFETDGGRYVVLDALTYTSMNDVEDPPVNPTPSDESSPTPTLNQVAASQTTGNGGSSGTNSTPIIAGVVIGVVLGLVAVGVVFYWFRHRKTILRRYGYIIGAGPSPAEDEEKATSLMFDMVTPGLPSAQERGNSRSGAVTPPQIPQTDKHQSRAHGAPVRSSIMQQLRIPIFKLHKTLPDLPPPSPTMSSTEESSTVVSQTRKTSFLPNRPFRRIQPPPVVPVNTSPTVKRSGTGSTIASFFPAAIDSRDLRKSLSLKSSRKSTSMASTPIDDQGRMRPELKAAYPIQPPLVMKDVVRIPASSSSTARSLAQDSMTSYVTVRPPPRVRSRPQPNQDPLPPVITGPSGKSTVVIIKSPTTPRSANLSSVKPRNLDAISESTSSQPNTPDSRSSMISKRSKRRSVGRRALERERSRKRLGRTTSSPRGPRVRTSASISSAPQTGTSQGPFLTLPPTPNPVTPNTVGTARRRPLPPSPSGLTRMPSVSRGPHVLVPVHLIPRLQSQRPSKSPSLNTKIAQWQQRQQKQAQSESPITQRSATEGTFSSTMSSSLLSTLAPSIVALFPNPPQGPQGTPSGDSLSSSLNTESRQAVLQLLTPSPTIRRPSRKDGEKDEKESAKSEGIVINDVENSEVQPAASTLVPLTNRNEASQTSSEPTIVLNTDLASSPVELTSPSRPLPKPLPPAQSPTPLNATSPTVISPTSPRRPLPVPLSLSSSNLNPSSRTSVPSHDPPPYSGRRTPSTFVTPAQVNESGPSLVSRLPPRNVPHTPSMASWSSFNFASMQTKLPDSKPSSLDSTSANALLELLEQPPSEASSSRTSQRISAASGVVTPVVSVPDPISENSDHQGRAGTATAPLPMGTLPPRPTPRHITKSRPPALSVISGSVVSSAHDTPSESRESDEYVSTSLDLQQPRPLSISKRSSVASVPAQKDAPAMPFLTPPPPPPIPVQSSPQQESRSLPSHRIGLPPRPSPRYLEVSSARPPPLSINSAASAASSVLDTPPASRSSEEHEPLIVNLPGLRSLSTSNRSSVASTNASRIPVPLATPPPLPSDIIPSPPRIRSKAWKAEVARGRTQPFPVRSRNRPANDTVTTSSTST
ncbi:hypothetical protein D9758_011863 [Tetrapyrgos nigripes]|uniref:Uncharacterized protein n=1 Tax=Tetrapyrgos nigripes TaxID=182062 RepID=A0A8H5FN98_9AGAR|nr:hypothetical protein D9758_011863 [Tetrapyrgos nigripes]